MVKLPSFDDLKKAGKGFMDQAKSGDYAGMVDKIKSGIDSVTVNRPGEPAVGDADLKIQLQSLQGSIDELNAAQSNQTAALRKLQSQLNTLTKTLESIAPAATTTTTTTTSATKNEEDKNS